jgi:hypothetical protein
MLEIRDRIGRLACVFDARTGLLEQAHKGCRTRTILHPGGTFTIEREGIVTVITRTGASGVKVTSTKTTA